MNLIVTTNPKPIVGTQKVKWKKAKQNTIESYQLQGRKAKKKGKDYRKERKNRK